MFAAEMLWRYFTRICSTLMCLVNLNGKKPYQLKLFPFLVTASGNIRQLYCLQGD